MKHKHKTDKTAANILVNTLFLCLFAGFFFACGQAPSVPKALAGTSKEPHATDSMAVDSLYLLGKFDPVKHPDFVPVGRPYSDKPGMLLRKEAFEAFKNMWAAAQKDGVLLKIISSTRNFDQQQRIWEGKWARFAKETPEPKARALKILEYSSMPGSSRHHWGTDIDLNDLNNPAFESGGRFEKVYAWLSAHAHEYGFCQPYTPGRPSGYKEEKWHWSYSPLSKPFLMTYKTTLDNSDIRGFQGANIAPAIGIVENYVLGINDACK